jgi:hypothetical protein
VSKERARRRAERLAVLEKEKAVRARRVARRVRRRTLVSKLRPRLGRTGTVHRFTRREKTGIVVVPLVAVAAVWFLIPDLGLRVVLILLIVLILPALTAVALGRR